MLNSSGQISLAGTTAGQSIQLELNGNGTTLITINDTNVRGLAGKASGVIGLADFYGKANVFYFNLTPGANVDLRAQAVAAGWNQSSNVVATLTSGSTIYSTSTASYALTIAGSFPNGVTLVNNGTITGAGGAGGTGADGYYGYAPTVGGGGGPAISTSVAVTIQNNGTIAGGGGGGGGGGSTRYAWSQAKSTYYSNSAGGGGGGGAGTNAGSGGSGPMQANQALPGTPGANGTATTGGAGGAGAPSYNPGGNGGNLGAAGAAGSSGGVFSGQAGGNAGNYITGNSFVTWSVIGTRLGNVA